MMTDVLEAFEQSVELNAALNEHIDEKPVKKERALNIQTVLKQADKRNFDYYSTLTEQGKKEFSPWVIQRWIANQKLEFVEEITNPLISQVPPEMAWRLFCAIGMPGTRRYGWDAPPKKLSGGKSEAVVKLVAKHYRVSTRVAKTYLPNLTTDQILEMADREGFDKKQIAAIKKALK